jgi:hypothetical protein
MLAERIPIMAPLYEHPKGADSRSRPHVYWDLLGGTQYGVLSQEDLWRRAAGRRASEEGI